MRSIRLSLLEVRSRRSPRPIITPFPGFPHPSAGQSPRPSSLLPLPLCVCKRTRPGARKRRRGGTRAAEENRSRGDRLAGGGGNFHPFRLSPRLGRRGGGGGRWSPRPSTANRNKFHADHATSCVYIYTYICISIRSNFIELSLSLSLLQPFYCLLFSSVDPRLDSIRVRGWGGRIRVEGKWAWRGEKCGCCWVIREDLFIGRFDESCICYLYWSVSLCTWLVRYI